MALERCPACNLPFAIVGRAHRCMPRPAPVAEMVLHSAPEQLDADDSQAEHATDMAGNSADAPAIGAYQSVMSVTPPATGDESHLHVTANRGKPAQFIGFDLARDADASAVAVMERQHDGTINVISISTMRKPPKRDRAAYMRDYRRLQKAKKNAGGAA